MRLEEIIHDRYEFTEDDKAIIDISLEALSDLFNSFDNKTSFYKRELDQDFEDYLVSSVKELEGHPFIIRINIENNYDKVSEEPSRNAIKNHFRFLYWKEKKKIGGAIRKFLLLTLLGTALMAFYYQHGVFIKDFENIPTYSKITIEGINIAGWVAFWEAFTCLIFDFIPITRNRKLYESISHAEVKLGKA